MNEFGQNGGHAVTTIPKLDWFSTTWLVDRPFKNWAI